MKARISIDTFEMIQVQQNIEKYLLWHFYQIYGINVLLVNKLKKKLF
jgi:hypothetical protein